MRPMRALMLMLVAVGLMAAGRVHAQSCSAIVAGPASFTGIVNTYYPGNGTASAGSTSISIGTSTGAGVPIASGDLLIVIQMQDAAINSSNTSSYGGSGGGQGQTNINNTGLYEYAVATNAVGTGGGTVTLVSGLSNTYRSAAANGTSGQKTFQVVRVPQASSATITGDLQATAWNGSSGGIVAIDVTGNLTWGGRTLDVAGRGFRGGGGQCSIGAGGTWANTDYRTAVVALNLAGVGTTPNGSKGEGVAGTPILVFTPTTIGSNAAGVSTNTGGTDGSSGGYPNGSFGRGAPGNGGGGGTDGNPPINDQNTGGAGGGNYGIGGKGGYGWTPGTPPGFDTGGFGGMAMPNSAARLFMGGGGGAGSTNNCTGAPAFGQASSGAAGGGIVFVRAGTTTGTVSIAANGTNGNSTITNDASGGGGAGGTVLVFVDNNGAAVNASIDVRGGNGGSNTGGGAPHGPGGGGSGGFAIVSGTATVTVAGGVNGTTATSPTSTAEYGSSPSVGGFQIVNLGAADIPGAGSNNACFPRLTVTKTTSTPFAAVGAPATYTITVSNLAGRSAATGVTLGDPLTNANITYASTSLVSLLGGATRPTTTNPTIGSNSPAWSSFTIPGGGSVALTFVASTTAALPPGTYQNPANVTYLDPTRTASQTVTPGGTYTAGAGLGTVPGSNYASASTTNEDVTFVAPPAFTKTFNPTAITVGAPTVLTVSVTNPGGTALTSVGFTDTYPSGVVNTASPGATTSCGGSVAATPNGTGFALAGASIPAGGSCTVTVNVTMTSPGPYTNTIAAGALTNTQNVTNPNPASAALFTNIRVVKSFSPNAVAPNSDSTLSLAIINDNTQAMNLANPGLTDVFPAGLVATGGAITVTGAGCTGFLPTTVGASATAVVFTAGLLPAASTCTVSFAVRSATTGIYANTTSGVTTTQAGTTGPVSNTSNLGVGVINIAKAFAPASIVSGATSTVTLTLTNPTGVAQTGGNFADTLVNMSVSGNQNTGGTCLPVTALTNGQTALAFAGLNVPIAGCTLTFLLTSSSVGAQSNTTGGVATALLPIGPTSNTAQINVLGRPAIAKAFSPTTISAGGISTLTFTITNPSPVPLTGAAFTDTYPVNLVNATPLTVSGSCTGVTTTATAGGNTFNVTAGSLPASSSCTITVAVTSSVTGIYNNTTTTGVATTQTGAAIGGSQSNTATLNVAATPTIVKSFGTSPIAQGGTSTMQFVVTNSNAGVALTNVRFTDNLVGMTVASPTLGGSCGASNSPTLSVGATALDITIPTIAAGGNCTITLTVTSNTSGSWPNTTSGATSTQTPVMGATSNTATLVVLSPPTFTKSFSPSFVQTGVASTITFTITNPQATALNNVAFTDTLVNMAVASAQATGGTCGVVTALAAGQTNLSYTVPTLAASASCTITLTVNSSTVSPTGGHPNTTSSITSTQTPTSGGAPATAYLNVLAAPTIAKAFSPNSVSGTTPSTITFTLTNPNAITLTNVRFTDTFPANMRTPAVAQNYIGAGRGTCVGAIPSAQGATNVTALSFAAITMPANSSCTITVDIELTADGAYTNTTSGVTTNQTTVGTGSSATISRGRIGLTKSFTPASVQVGGTSTMAFTLLNNTGGTVNNITLTDTFPAGMVATGGAVIVSAGACTNIAPNTIAANATAYALTDLDNLTAGASCTISMSVTGSTSGVKANTVTGTLPAAITGVASTANLTVYAPPTIAKAFSPATIAAGGNSTITFTLANPNTFATLANASFTDTLVNMTVNNTVVGGTCVGTTPSTLTVGATALSFSGISLPANGTCTVTVVITSSTPGTRPNTVSGVTTTQTPTAGTGNGPVNLTVAGIDLTKSFNPASRPVGVPATLTFTVTSPSSVAWSNLAFTDTLPANLQVASPSNASTSCGAGVVTATPGSNVISLAGGTMASGASPCLVNVDVVSPIAGTYNNAAANFSGLSPGVGYTGGTVSVVYFNNATVTKAFAPATIAPNGTSTLTFTINNPAGSQATSGLGFTDTLPANVVVAATPAAGNTCGATFAPAPGSSVLTLSGGSRPVGPSSCTAQVDVTSTVLGTYNNASANFSALAGGLTAATANATLNVVGTALVKAFSPAAIGRGGVSTLTFTINNGAGNPAQSALGFLETLPTNVFVAGAPAIVNGCGGTVTAAASTNTIQLAGGVIAASVGSCTFSVNVTTAIVGSYFNGPAQISGASSSMDTSGVNATLVAAENPAVAKSFAPTAVGLNTNSLLTITLTNANAVAITGAAFTDTYPGTMVNAPVPTGATTCGGTVTAVAAANSVALAGGTIPASGSCTVTVFVRSATAGTFTNNIPIGAVSSTNAGVNPVAASAVLNVLAPLTVAKAYAPNPVVAGSPSTLTITLTNSNAFAAAAGVAFTDTNPVGVLNTATPAGNTTCGGPVTAAANGTSVALSGGTVPAGGSCVVTVQQAAAAGGAYANVIAIGDVTTTNAGSNAAAANATLNAYGAPTFTKAFGATIGPGGTTTLAFTVTNPAGNPGAVSGIGFTDVFPTSPAAMTLFDTTVGNTCAASTLTDSGGAALNAGDVGVQAGNISLAAGATCVITVNVTAPAVGSYVNTSATITATTPVALTGTTAAATLTVAQPTLTKAFTPASVTVGGSATLVFTLTNAAGNPAQSGINFTDTLPVGLAVAGTPNFQSNCPAGGALVNNPAFLSAPGGVITVAGAAMNAALASCEIRVNVTPSGTATAGACPQPNNTNTTGNIGGLARLSNGVTAQCLAVSAAVPTLDKAFSGALVVGGTANLTFTISQPANNPTQTFSFTDTLPAGLVVDAGGATGTCTGGSVTATSGASSIVVAGRQVTGAFCTIIVPVRASGTPTAAQCPAANNTNGDTNISLTTNVTAAIANSAAGGGTSTTGACVTVVARPAITKAYSPNPAVAGTPTTLTITLANSNPTVAITGAAFTDTNPAGVLNTAAPAGSTTCGGTVTAAASGTSVALAGGTIPANGSCTVTVQQSAAAAGSYLNTIAAGDLTTTNGGSNTTAATATLDAFAAPTIAKAFGPTTIGPGGTSTLTFTLTNPAANTQALTGVAFSDTFPVAPGAMVVATPPAASTSGCGTPTFTPVAGAASITFSGGTVAVGGTCTVTVNVVAPAAGSYANTSGAVSATGPVALAGNTASATLTVTQAALTKAFAPAAVDVSADSTLTFTLTNGAGNPAQAGINFTDTLPAGLVVAPTPAIASNCPSGTGVVAATAGTGVITVTGASMTLAQASCTISVAVRAAAAGTYNNTNAANISATQFVTTTGVNATLTVQAVPAITKAFAVANVGLGQTTTLSFSIANTGTNAVARSGIAFTDTLPAGLVIANPPVVTSAACGAPAFTALDNTQPFTASGVSVAAGATCSIVLTVRGTTLGAKVNGAAQMSAVTGLINGVTNQTVTVVQAALTKAFSPAAVDANTNSTLTFTLTNGTGNPAQSGINFTDTLPAGLVVATPNGVATTCPSGTGVVAAVAGSGVITVTGATLGAALASCTISVNVVSATAGTYNNTNAANIGGTARVDTTGVNATLTVQAIADLTKAFAAPTVNVGATTTLTFTINNTAPSAVNRTGIAFTDTLPAGISIANPPLPTTNGNCGTPAFTAADNTQVFTASAVAVNAGDTCTITLAVRGVTPGVATNGNGNVSTTGITNGVTDQAINVVAAPTITKVFVPAAINADATSTITFTIANANPALPLTGAGFGDTLAGMAIAAPGGAAGGTCVGAASNSFAAAATSLAFTGLTISPGASCTVTVVVTSDVPGPHNNQATGVSSVEAPTGAASNVATLTVTAATPTIAKAFAPATIALGGSSTVTFTLANPNGVALTGAGFTDTLSAMSIAAPGGPAGGSCAGAATNAFAAAASNLVFTGLTVPANGSCTVTVSVTSATPGTHNNQATGVTSAEAAIGAASNVAALTVTAQAPTISKVFAAPISSGGVTTLTITINNPNAAPITVTSVTDTFPPAPGTGMARAPTPAASTSCATGTVSSTATSVTLTGGVVPANGSCAFQIDVTAASSGSYLNTIAAGALTTNVGSNAAPASATLVVSAIANLGISKAGPATIATGALVTYTITVTNAGPDAANNATFADNVPAALTGVGASCAGTFGASCAAPTVTGNAVTGTIATLPVGGIATYTITGTATGASAISNTATIAAPPGVTDPTPANNTSTANTTVLAADLTLAKTHAGNFTIGANGNYTLVVSNDGTLATSGTVTVSDPLPAGLGFVSATGTGWTCGFAGDTVTCTSSTPIAPASAGNPITLVVSVASVAAPSVNNIASVSGGGEPPVLAYNNIGSDNTIVAAAATNRFAPSGAQTALPGTVVFYPHTFNAGSAGTVAFSTTAIITPASPAWTQIVYRDTNCNGVLDGAEGAVPLTTGVAVAAGDTVCIVVKDSIPIYAPYNSVSVTTVTATFNGTETYVQQDITTVGAVAGAGLTLSKTVRNVTQGAAAGTSGTARPDDVLEYTITYTNAASGPLSSIVVTDATPAFTTFLSAACPAPPPNLTGCAVTSQPSAGGTGSVVWTLAGSLLSNGVGSVTYQVRVAP